MNVDSGVISNDLLSPSKASCGVRSLQYLNVSHRLMVTTTDNRIILYSMYANFSISYPPHSRHPSFPLSIIPISQHMGSFDDILGISIIPDPTVALDTLTSSDIGPLRQIPLLGSMRLAIVSNSPVVHLLDKTSMTTNLVGHTDVVLAIQCSVDGYSNFSPAFLIFS